MKKIIPIVIIGVLLISGLGAVAFPETEQKKLEKEVTITFSELQIVEENDNSILLLDGCSSWLKKPNHPMIPAFSKTYTFPFGTKVESVDVVFSDTKQILLDEKIATSPKPATFILNDLVYAESENIQSEIYPEKQFSYSIGAGIYKNDHVIFVTVKCYPIQYVQSTDTIFFSRNADVKISYKQPSSQATIGDAYNMVVIAPNKFSTALQPLINHKNDNGVVTKLVTVEEIYDSTYFPVQGRDCAEEVKYFIKSAYDEWGIDYVLLVGGRHGGVMQEKWWVPVRYSHLDDDNEGSFVSDLYFADIYEGENNFSSWDSNENDVFAEWVGANKDILDMYPDVYLGRLPCRNTFEVKIMVNKIINYENTAYGSEWFNKIVCVGGDSAPGDLYYEGEEENQAAIDYLDGFESVKLWTSDGSFTGVNDVVSAISEGSGFLFFDGHGNPTVWSTHPPNDEETWITGLNNKDMPKLINGKKLPVAVIGGCHNGQFNVSILNILKGIIEEGLSGYFSTEPPLGSFWYKEWTPECWAWLMARKIGGGSIAIMAYTGLDWFATGDSNGDDIPDCTQFYSGFCNTNFFKNYAENNLTILGTAHTQTLIDYINEYPPMDEKLDCKTVQEFTLLGDPSLQIGGYQ